MTIVAAYEDACATARRWEEEGLFPFEVGRLLGVRFATWETIINHLVTELLIADDGGQLSLRLAA